MNNIYKEIRNNLKTNGLKTGIMTISRGYVEFIEPVDSDFNEQCISSEQYGKVMLYCYDKNMKLLNIQQAGIFNN